MSYQPQQQSGYPPNYYPHSPHANGNDSMLLGSMLGELKSGQTSIVSALGAQTDVLQDIHQQLRDNASLMSERLKPPQPEPPTVSLNERIVTVREILKTLVPLALLVAIVMGKITVLEAWPLLRQSLGIGGG
jgi:hypothetical protein